MRIHSNTLTAEHIANIVNGTRDTAGPDRADIRIMGITKHRSQSRAQAFEVALSGNGTDGGAYGALDYKVATWDEWGIVLNALFDADPELTVPRVYESADHFHWVTGDRYRTLRHGEIHLRHRWGSQYDAWTTQAGNSATGSYHVSECKCGAILRRMGHGRTWSADIAHEFDGVV